MATRKTAVKAETSTSAVKATTAEEASVKETAVKAEKEIVKEAGKTEETEKEAVKETVKTEKPAAKKAAAKKPAAKRTTTRKTAAKKAAATEIFIQFGGKEVYAKDIETSIRNIWTEELGRKEAELEDMKVYIKPEEGKAYYVINGDVTGSVEL